MQEHAKNAESKTDWKAPVIGTVLALVATIAILIMLSQLVTGLSGVPDDDESATLSRIKPVGEVLLAAASGPKVALTGERVYGQVCKTCHEGGLAGAPKFGDKAAWGKVIAQGQTTATEHAINGIRAMPAKGGNPDLENVEVERAVAFMANKAGANWIEPAAPPAAIAPSAAAAPAAVAPAPAAPVAAAVGASAAAASAASAKPDGKKIYDTTCVVCHASGVAGAPKFGDKAAWAPRLKTGVDALYASALKGKAAMPARGGNTSLGDTEVKAAVDYMVAAAK